MKENKIEECTHRRVIAYMFEEVREVVQEAGYGRPYIDRCTGKFKTISYKCLDCGVVIPLEE